MIMNPDPKTEWLLKDLNTKYWKEYNLIKMSHCKNATLYETIIMC
jgi:hypothetical protein